MQKTRRAGEGKGTTVRPVRYTGEAATAQGRRGGHGQEELTGFVLVTSRISTSTRMSGSRSRRRWPSISLSRPSGNSRASDYARSRLPGRQQIQAAGHSVRRLPAVDACFRHLDELAIGNGRQVGRIVFRGHSLARKMCSSRTPHQSPRCGTRVNQLAGQRPRICKARKQAISAGNPEI
jgi:hypothetical protein